MQFLSEARLLLGALRASIRKIAVFLCTVLTLVMIFGALMYVVEGAANGFTSIPRSIYWAIVTMTTVGYGDVAPLTALSKRLAVFEAGMGSIYMAIIVALIVGRYLSPPADQDSSEPGGK